MDEEKSYRETAEGYSPSVGISSIPLKRPFQESVKSCRDVPAERLYD
jgi:hypothetical protein